MATHLAARLVWHDRGWDGRFCGSPKDNGWCIRHEYVHKNRDDDEEAKRCGEKITDSFLPPCVNDANAFAPTTGYTFQHTDPLFRSYLSPKSEHVGAFSFVTAPFRQMREERGW